MLKTISAPELQRIRTGNYVNFHMLTLAINSKARFRGLGANNSRNFLLESLHYFDAIGLSSHRDAAYLIFIMTHLGTHFLVDPRYYELRSLYYRLAPQDPHVTDKVRDEFIKISHIYFGKKKIGYYAALSNLVELCETESLYSNTPSGLVLEYLGLLGLSQMHKDQFPMQPFLDQALDAAQVLKIDTEKGRLVAATLAFWLGTGFHRDPLYPWVQELCAGKSTAQQRVEALRHFGIKRASSQVKFVKEVADI